MCQFLPGFPGNSPSLAKGGTAERGGVVAVHTHHRRCQCNYPGAFHAPPLLDKKGMELPAGQDLVSLGLDPGLRRDDDAQAGIERSRRAPG